MLKLYRYGLDPDPNLGLDPELKKFLPGSSGSEINHSGSTTLVITNCSHSVEYVLCTLSIEKKCL